MAKSEIAFYIALGFLGGVFAAGGSFGFFLAVGISLGGVALFALILKKPIIVLSLAVAIGLGAGFFYYVLFGNAVSRFAKLPPVGKSEEFSGVIISDPVPLSGEGERFRLRLSPPFRGTIEVIADDVFEYGDKLSLSGKLREPSRGLTPIVLFPDARLISKNAASPFRAKLLFLKQNFLEGIFRYLPARESALMGGLTLGAREAFDPSFLEDMRRSGTTHLVALSGYNVGILVISLFGACVYFFSRRTTFIITTGIIFGFVLMVGGEPSVVRAAIMGFLALLAKEMGRYYSFSHGIVFAAAGMAALNPSLPLSPGFQLSFVSLLGIAYLEPALRWFLDRNKKKDAPRKSSLFAVREHLLASLAAQLAVIPILGISFGFFSPTSIAANLLVLPLVPVTMFFGFILGALGAVVPPLAFPVALLVEPLLAYETGVIALFSKWSFPVAYTFSIVSIFFYYAVLGSIVWYAQKRFRRRPEA